MQNQETSKNIKAGTITGIICGLLVLLLFMVSWTTPVPAVQPIEEGIEVNLGNSETGLGDEAPLVPGDPALIADQPKTVVPITPTENVAEKEKETNDNDKEAPNVTVPVVKKDNNKPVKIITEPIKPVIKPVAKPVVAPDPKPVVRKPVAVYNGGSSSNTGGNQADDFNKKNNQGISGGNGDQGKSNGTTTSDNYTGGGGSGKSGVSVSRGLQGRRISKVPSFEDDFNENAKIAIDVKVDENGVVVGANFQPKGSTTSNASMREIAIKKAKQIKFSPSDAGESSIGTLIFNFKVQ